MLGQIRVVSQNGLMDQALEPVARTLIDLVLADFAAYLAAQDAMDHYFRNEPDWARKSILNVARIGRFSSDRSVADYASAIWRIAPGG